MYSRDTSEIRGHQDRSSERSFRRFSVISSIPSSVIFVQPDKLRIVRLGSECTENLIKIHTHVYKVGSLADHLILRM